MGVAASTFSFAISILINGQLALQNTYDNKNHLMFIDWNSKVVPNHRPKGQTCEKNL